MSQYRWKKVTDTAAFSPRDGAGALVFDDKMWLLGGWNPYMPTQYPRSTNSEVFNSTDGREWSLVAIAPWEERHCAGYVVYDNKMWIVGGDSIQEHYQNDVWCSSNGIDWTCVAASVPWRQRVTHHVVAYGNKIWVMGGQEIQQRGLDRDSAVGDVVYNDVWNSTDGANWTRVIDHAAWQPRGQILGTVVLDGKIWILGGATYAPPSKFYNDVWNSADGITWNLVSSAAPWPAREWHSVAVFDNRMWVMAGNVSANNMNDVWFSDDGEKWCQLKGTPWPGRHAASVFVYDNALWLVAGYLWHDVWKLERVGSPRV